MGSSDLMGLNSVVGRICIQKSSTNRRGAHEFGCKATYISNAANSRCLLLFTVMNLPPITCVLS